VPEQGQRSRLLCRKRADRKFKTATLPASNDYVTNIINDDSDIQALSLGSLKCVIDVFKNPIWIASKSEHGQSPTKGNSQRMDSSSTCKTARQSLPTSRQPETCSVGQSGATTANMSFLP
jgi:hypothetical protein